MSEGEVLPPTVPFTRGCKARASLPVGRSSGQTRERLPGVLYLQYGEETKQVRITAEISSPDALRALFVTAFPHQLTMKMLQSPNMAIYIKDTSRNVYYDLEDIRNITPHSCLKVYHKDPAHVFNRHARPANTEGRLSKEVLYGSHSPVHALSSSSRGTLHSLQGSMSPPMVRSMPSSPSRMAYGGGSTGGRAAIGGPGSTTLPRDHLSAAGRSSSICSNSSSSAILERKDVKPDDVANSKTMALVVRGEGGPHYPDSYCSAVQDGGGGRLSMASSQCSAPPSLTADMVDAGVTGIPGGLQQYRASIKPLMGYGESMEHQTRPLHRQKSRTYGESQLPPLGTKTPPPSPHRVNEVRIIDGQIIGGVGLVSKERMSPIRRSLRRDSNGAPVEIVNRSRGSGSSSSSVFLDSPVGQPERQFPVHVTTSNAQSERMKAMEQQIASLAGLVHSALSMGPDIPGLKDTVSENAERRLLSKRPGVSSEPASYSPVPLALQALPSDSGLQQSLVLANRNVCELRLQLNQLRHLQLSNQESVGSMLRMAGQELVVLMYDRLAQSEEAAYRRRAEMEEERIHYLAAEETILTQLHELEDYVDHLQHSSASSPDQLSVTLRDVEEGAVNLRRIGEALAILKGEYPELQGKMRSVLRLEVEAVRFLKEEPHKMDSMLKRVKDLTEGLSRLRRYVSESATQARPAHVEPVKTDPGPLKTQSPQSSPKPQPRSSVRPPQPSPSLSGSASPIMARRMNTAAPTVIQPSQHHPSPPLTPTHGRDSPTVAKVSPRSREGSPALQRRPGPLQSPTQESPADRTTMKHSQNHTGATERQPPVGSLSVTPGSTNHSSTSQAKQSASCDTSQPPHTNTNTDCDQVLQEALPSLIKSIPDLNVSNSRKGCSDSVSGQITSTASESEQDMALDPTRQAASVEQQALLSDSQEDTAPQLTDEVDSTQLQPPGTAPATASQLPAATVKPPPSAPVSASPSSATLAPPSAAPSASPSASPSAVPSASPSASPSNRRPQVEKPRRTSVDKEIKQSPERAGKSSPPPPPPRRFHAVNSGLTTGRSGEVIVTTRKEPVGAQDEGVKEPPVVPQPKPLRQPPEVKPKPQMCAPAHLAGSTSTFSTASAHREDEEEEEEEEEDSKFMKELQVFQQKCSVRNVGSRGVAELPASDFQNRGMESKVTTELSNYNDLPGGNKQWKKEERTSTNIKISELATSDHQSVSQMVITDGCPHKFITAVGLEGHTEVKKDNVNPDEKETEVNELKQLPSSNCARVEKVLVPLPVALQDVQTVQKNEELPTTTQKKAEKMEGLAVTTSQKQTNLTVKSSDRINKEVVGQVCSPSAAEKKVKLTTVVTLQKEKNQATDTSPEQTNENSVKEVPAEKKSNLMVFVTLQKENTPEDCLIKIEQDKSLNSDPECVASSPVLKLLPQNFYPRDQSQNTEEGGTLSPDIWDNEGPPPPPPPTGKISLRNSKTRSPIVLTQPKEEDLAEMTADGDSTGEPIYLGFQDSDDSDKKPIIIFLNEPLDIQSAYKRLSTIFECEEDFNGILFPENIEEEKETMQDEEKQDIRNMCLTKSNIGNGQMSLHMQHQRTSGHNGSISENQDQDKPESPRKPDTKRKFKFKFPRDKLAAISQAIRTGTTKTGKKTLQVVVYEEEEEIASDRTSAKTTKKKTKESKRFETNNTKQLNLGEGNICDRDIKVSSPIETRHSKSRSQRKELCKTTLDSIDSLEESIKQLEISVGSMSAPSSPSCSIVSSLPLSTGSSVDSTDRAQLKDKAKRERERSPSKRPASQILKGPNPPQSKRAKAQPPHDTGKTSTKKQTSNSSASSSAQRFHTKSRPSLSSDSPEKTAKGQQQATQKQADGRSSRAAGDSSHSLVALRASKIPALCHSSGKHPSACLSTPHCSDTTELSSSSSSSASSPSSSSTPSSGKDSLLSPPSKCASRPSSASSAQPPRQQASLCPLSASSTMKNTSDSPPRSPSLSSPSFSVPAPPHKSFIPSLNLSRLLPSSSHVLSPSHASVSLAQHGPSGGSSKHQHHLTLTATSSAALASQHSYYTSSIYSSSSPSSSSTSSSLSPTSSSSSPPSPSPSPSSTLLSAVASHGAGSVRLSASNPNSPGRGRKRGGRPAGQVLRTAAASKDTA